MLDKTMLVTMHKLVRQHVDDLNIEKSRKGINLLEIEAKKGLVEPSGSYYGGLFDLKLELIEMLPKIVWGAAIEVLDAYKPEYYPGIEEDIKQELDRYFPKRLSEPDDYIHLGLSGPHFRNKDNERSSLEMRRHSSVCKMHTMIDLYTAKIKPKEGSNNMHGQPVIININGSITNSPFAINSANANQFYFRIDEIQSLIGEIKEAVNQSLNITEDERKAHLINIENLESELNKSVPDKNFILKSIDNLAGIAKNVGTIASSFESLKALFNC